MCRVWIPTILIVSMVVATSVSPVKGDGLFDQAMSAYEAKDWSNASRFLAEEVEANPGNELAYYFLGKAMEEKFAKSKDEEDRIAAFDAWSTLLALTGDEDVRREARKGFLRTRDEPPIEWTSRDLFHVPDIDIDYDRLEDVDSTDYMNGYPPIFKETKHFFVASCNYELTRVLGDICEKYLTFLTDKLLDGRAWVQRVPILCYKDQADYAQKGGNGEGSLGVTWRDNWGRVMRVAIFQLSSDEEMEFQKVDHPVKGNIEDTLPHELTHMVLFEFFGTQQNPLWLHEGCARQMEQYRDDPAEAALLARDVVSGEWLRFRDFWDLPGYPTGGQSLRFYDQSATIVWFLFEHGQEAFRAFLDEVALGHGWDAAAAAALGGIPEEGAVEEFERRWALWMQERYVKDLKEEDGEETKVAKTSESPLFKPGYSLELTRKAIEEWNNNPMFSMADFRGVEGSDRYWSVEDKRLLCNIPEDSPFASLLGIRIYEQLPVWMECKFKWTGHHAGEIDYFGIGQLDIYGDDLGVQVVTELDDRRTHDLTCVLDNYLTVYVDGEVVGRYPAVPPRMDQDDIDYPLAFVASSPMEITDIRTGRIEKFVVERPADDKDEKGKRRGRGRH